MNIEFDKHAYNPIYWHLKKYLEDPKIRYIYVYGSSSAGKTYTEVQLLAERAMIEKVNVKIYRKESTTIWDSVYNDFKKLAGKINDAFVKSNNSPFFNIKKRWIDTSENEIVFSGLDDPEKAKGLSDYKYIFMNELSKFNYEDLKEVRRRMRGIFGQTLICDWNPISKYHWMKTLVIDRDKWFEMPQEIEDSPGTSLLDEMSSVKINKRGNAILIKTTYKDNWWIVGHPIEGYGFTDQNTLDEFEDMRLNDPYDYQIYGLGDWGTPKKGGEFFHAFDYESHVKKLKLDISKTIHISIDNNVLPYIAITVWQMEKNGGKWIVDQIHELPARDPNNSANLSATVLTDWLEKIGYNHTIYLYGDPTTKARNTISDDKKSFLDLFTESIKKKGYDIEERFFRKAPPVATTADFINAIYSNRIPDIEINISELCNESINDYLETKKDKDGGLLKQRVTDKEKGLSWEKNGHLTDTKRYFICKAFEEEMQKYKNRFVNYRESIPDPEESFLKGGF